MEKTEKPMNTQMVGITEITERYLPMSKRKARKFVSMYLDPIQIGNQIYVSRVQLEQLLNDPDGEKYPLNL